MFRTFNASFTLEQELPSGKDLEGLSIAEKVTSYNAANRQVAILCNHQKTVSKALEQGLENLGNKLETMKSQLRDMSSWKDMLKKAKTMKNIPLKESDSDVMAKIKSGVEKAESMKEKAKTDEERLKAIASLEVRQLFYMIEEVILIHCLDYIFSVGSKGEAKGFPKRSISIQALICQCSIGRVVKQEN